MSDLRTDRETSVAEALGWIRETLSELGIPFQIVGGLAAIAHGSARDLHDIDLYVPEGALEEIRPRVAEHHSHGPGRHLDEHWDCLFMEVRYAGEEIEIADAARTRYRGGPEEPWRGADVDFEASVEREAFGVQIPVMPLDQLVAYKRRLDRAVDRRDLAELGAT